jgi:hypothetical protein
MQALSRMRSQPDQQEIALYVQKSPSQSSPGTIDVRVFPSVGPIKNIAISVFDFFAAKCRGKTAAKSWLYERNKHLGNTVECLHTIFGAKRVERVLQYLKFDAYWKTGQLFTRGDMALFMCGLELITVEDMQDLLDELHEKTDTVRQIPQKELVRLRGVFKDTKLITECNSKQLGELEQQLLPFDDDNDEFWHNCDNIKNQLPLSREELIESAAWVRRVLRTQKLDDDSWEVAVAKRFAAIKLPPHFVLPHPQGYMFLTNAVEGRSLKYFFRKLGNAGPRSFVLYGTTTDSARKEKFGSSYTSYFEDMRPELGTKGIVETFDKTKEILSDPSLGFISGPSEKIEFIGHSLGGAQAMRDTVLFHNQVARLTCVCCPGVDQKTAELFAKIVQNKELPLNVKYIVEDSDIISLSGTRLLGSGCQSCKNLSISVKVLRPSGSHECDFFRMNINFRNIVNFPSAVKQNSRVHMRLLALEPHETTELQGAKKEAFLNHDAISVDPSWEVGRRVIGALCFQFSGWGFSDFAKRKIQEISAV